MPGSTPKPAISFRFVTLNIFNGGRLLQNAIDFLTDTNPDIFFIQEAYDGDDPTHEPRFRTTEVISAAFPEYFSHFCPVYLDTRGVEGPIEDGQVIYSRYPLSNVSSHFLDIPYGEYSQDDWGDFTQFPAMIQYADVLIGATSIRLANVHGPVNYDGKLDDGRRRKMRDSILKYTAGYERVIAAGDFNMQPETKTIDALEERFVNIFKGELRSTFNMKHKERPGYATAVVDMVLATPNLMVTNHHCPDVDVSDHMPLVVDFKLS